MSETTRAKIPGLLLTEQGRQKLESKIARAEAKKQQAFQEKAKAERVSQKETNLKSVLKSARLRREDKERAEKLGIPAGIVRRRKKN